MAGCLIQRPSLLIIPLHFTFIGDDLLVSHILLVDTGLIPKVLSIFMILLVSVALP